MTPTPPVLRVMLILFLWLTLLSARSQDQPSTTDAAPRPTPQVVAPDGRAIANQLQRAVATSATQKRYHEVDVLVERTVRYLPNDRHVLFQAARIYAELEPAGYWINGRYRRGDEVGTLPDGTRRVFSKRRDHRRALQLLERAILVAQKEWPSSDLGDFYWEASQILIGDKGYSELYSLTDLSELPKLDLQEPPIPEKEPVPVDENGDPVFFEIPSSWQTARNDGERLLWLLHRARTLNPEFDAEAEFVHTQYLLRGYLGVDSVIRDPGYDVRTRTFEGDEESSFAIAEIPELTPDESVARLSTGIRKITLPDQHNYIRRLEAIANEPRFSSHAEEALEILGEIFQNRRQYDRASQYWRESIRRFGTDTPTWESRQLAQITEGWGTFEPTSPSQAGEPLSLGFWYRNSTHAHFQAYRVDVNRLLDDMLTYLRGNPFPLDSDRIDLSQLGTHFVREGGDRYLDESVAQWEQELAPHANHWDDRIEVPLPFSSPGAYLIEARLKDGNTSTVMVWINDMSIVRRDVKDGLFYYVADKRKGTPIPWVKFSFIGYRLEPVGDDEPIPLDEAGEEIPEPLRRQYHVRTKETVQWADAKGQLIVGDEVLEAGYQWFLLASAPGDRIALLGFSDLISESGPLNVSSDSKHFIAMDRPYYHPGETVHCHAWLRKQTRQKDEIHLENLAGKEVVLSLHDSDFEIVWNKAFRSDENGAIEAKVPLPAELTPGRYRLVTECEGSTGTAELDIAERAQQPPVVDIETNAPFLKRGDDLTATIRARFHDGEALAHARLTCRVVRRPIEAAWHPKPNRDWLYGPNYGWTSENYEWFPGWRYWGWPSPGSEKPEATVFDEEITLNAEGEFILTLPTPTDDPEENRAVAETYTITTEWTGATPPVRSETSTIVSMRPFKVYTRMHRSFYETGDEAIARIQALDYLGNPVRGKARFIVYRIEYDEEGLPIERGVVGDYFSLDEKGQAEKRFRIDQPGQYRTSCEITGPDGDKIEGATVTTFVDDSFTGEGSRFNALEILMDQPHYRPGETVNLRLNTNRPGQSVALFVRPRDGANARAEVLRLEEKSRPYTIRVTAADVPSFHVEAITLSNGGFEIHTKEIPVLSGKVSTLNLTSDLPEDLVTKPGATHPLTFSLADFQNIASASPQLVVRFQPAEKSQATEDLRHFFWSRRQPYEASVEHDLTTRFDSYAKPPEMAMRPIGLFSPLLGHESQLDAMEDEWPDASNTTVLPPTAGWLTTTGFNEEGQAQVELPLPEMNGRWRVEAWAVTNDTRIGSWEGTVSTQEPFRTHFQHPEFAVAGDTAELTARIHNLSKLSAPVSIVLSADGASLDSPQTLGPHVLAPLLRHEQQWSLTFSDTDQAQLDWHTTFGDQTTSRTNILPIARREQASHSGWAGRLSSTHKDDRYPFVVDPSQKSELAVSLAPSLPALLISGGLQTILEPTHAPAEILAHRMNTVSQTSQLLSSMELDTSALSQQSPEFAPLFDPAQRAAFFNDTLEELAALQHEDGGWSWGGSPKEPSDALTTAWVIRTLLASRNMENPLVSTLLNRSIPSLKQSETAQCIQLRDPANGKPTADTQDAFVFYVLTQADAGSQEMRDYLFRDWEKLSHYGKINLSLALHKRNETDDRNIIRFFFGEKLRKDEARDTLALQSDQEPDSLDWYGSDPDLQSLYLLFLVRAKGASLVTDTVANGVLNFRQNGGLWENPRETSLATEALAEYANLMKLTPNDESAGEVELTLTKGNTQVVSFDSTLLPKRVTFTQNDLTEGDHELTLSSSQSDTLYHHTRFTTLSEPAQSSHAYLTITRTYQPSIEPDQSDETSPPVSPEHPLPPTPTIPNGEAPPSDAIHQDRSTPPTEVSLLPEVAPEEAGPTQIASGEILEIGEVIEVVLKIETKRALQQIVIEDHFPAGCELLPLNEPNSPSSPKPGTVAFYLPELTEGSHEFRYRFKARHPGTYSALSASAHAAFNPQIKATSGEFKFTVSSANTPPDPTH